ncbi:c6 zinc finger domain containing protein [Niveomyces insectorum RCEF 264]|uniref:C6 zinc finger domain containing protein n=1 Tax=Niveomyces insectorum RCEF 264 TaxID=1081102 RepID=A0A167SN56_9HYPO|nr:c6 zinc finger domain containing protein [Niveomyces insectorum RCEF 264]
MSAADFYGWVPPTLQTANFSDCDVAAKWLAATVNSLYNGTHDNDPPMQVTFDYISTFVPSNMSLPTFGQAAQWFGSGIDPDFYQAMIEYPFEQCPAQICNALVWTGDADLAGIGVMVVFYLEAVFATMYFVLLAVDQWEPFRRRPHHRRRWTWVVGAFQESLQAFMDTGLLFAIAMLVAGVYRHGSSRLHPDKTHSIYQLTNATYIAIFSVFPPLMLQMVTHHKRRLRIRATLWLAVVALAVAIVALYFSLTTSTGRVLNLLDRESAITDLIWEADCEPVDLRGALDDLILTACSLLALNCLVWFYHTLVPSSLRDRLRGGFHACLGRHAQKPGRYGRSWWDNVRRTAKIVNGVLCGLIMWALLGLFTGYRSAVLSSMGTSNSDGSWSFSQVFALATWVPVAIDLVTIYIYGAQESLEGKVSENFQVVEVNEKNPLMDAGGGEMGGTVYRSDLDPYQVVEPTTYTQLGQTGVPGPVHTAGDYQDDTGAYKGPQPTTYEQTGTYDPSAPYAQQGNYVSPTAYGYDRMGTHDGQPPNYGQPGHGGGQP